VLTSCMIGGLRDAVWYSGHTGTISIAVLVLRASQNVMKPRIQGGRIQLVVATVS